MFSPGRDGAPTWSWMSRRGGIDFIPVPGDTVDWANLTLQPQRTTVTRFCDERNPRTLIARAHDFWVDLAEQGKGDAQRGKLIFDFLGVTAEDAASLRCVVVGREKQGSARGDEGNRLHFVLFVAPAFIGRYSTRASQDLKVYNRIGAGSMVGRCIIGLGGGGDEVAIV